MPIYRFHVPTGVDPEPVELPHDDAAWSEAVTLCGEMLRDVDGNLPSPTGWLFEVFDASGGRIIEIEVRAQRHGAAPEQQGD
ncbi:DUF6894 family protein [Terrihabitans rhizophilus]|jgi:hypothetical protein|uniref:DUF6894 domain-containing protein n=1 Tax=Terrihabitans rhizophilus TaxID=3092662 RepID=A0ABU4RNK3_9HYPH|nr:hypothetical protein [Terrihabitans sp. PJ23]MDX6806420.1 hypothetical protein [Terrihabitans sp. PJ23]